MYLDKRPRPWIAALICYAVAYLHGQLAVFIGANSSGILSLIGVFYSIFAATIALGVGFLFITDKTIADFINIYTRRYLDD